MVWPTLGSRTAMEQEQCAAVPLVAQDVISAPASQAFVERLFVIVWKNLRDSVAKSEL